MKRFCRKLIKSTKGAVTVFVSLLLIPAILVSGTAVDLTRIYTAKSIVADANQLAANSVLTQYDALLHDLYGLFGIAKNDPVLAELLDEYISVTVFGESSRDTSMGTLQLFYGSNLSLEEIYFPERMNLRNPEVLRRQIEEYMKFRAPVIIVSEVMEMLGSSTFQEDSEVIADKLDIDEALAEMFDKYKELYDAIIAADLCTQVPSDPAGALGNVSSYLGNIRTELRNLKKCLDDWADEDDDSEDKDDYASKYRAIRRNIEIWVVGGNVGKTWRDGAWTGSSSVIGLNQAIENAIVRANRFKPKFDTVVSIANQLDGMNTRLNERIDALEEKLDSEDCSPELRDALTRPDPETGKTLIEEYRDILKWDDIESMADIYKDGGYDYIDDPVTNTLRSVIYRDKNDPSSTDLTREQMTNATSTSKLGLIANNRALQTLAGYSTTDISYDMPDGFVKFGEHPGDNHDFFEELKAMIEGGDAPPVCLFDGQDEASGRNAEKKQEKMIDQLFDMVKDAYAGITNNQMGAEYVSEGTTGADAEAISFRDFAEEAASNPVSSVISNPLGSLAAATGDYLLLLTYCSSMFSNYTTGRPQANGKTIDDIDDINFPETITSVPISPKVNYFFQSEWEYLYNGDNNANKNLNAVSRLIYLVRMICNYITVFKVSEVTRIVKYIKTTFSWNPILALVLSELARAAFVAAESAVDLSKLRAGHKVELLKSKDDWICSPSGVVSALSDAISDAADDDSEGTDDEKGMTYSNYLLFFFIAKAAFSPNAANELATRTADLIEWNVLNYKGGFLCDEDSMTEALGSEGRFKMQERMTDFSITTTADMRMLFLSMPVAQNFSGSRGIFMPQTFPVTVTDYRGY